MVSTRSARVAALSSLVSIFAIACGGKTTPPPATAQAAAAPKTSTEVHEKVIPHTCAARTKLAQLLGHTEAPPAPASNQAAESAAPPATSVEGGGAAKVAANQVYRMVAPATVLVRTDHGMGTGVVIDPKGYILTNYHVIADGREKDFVVSVQVSFGDLTPTGRMSRQEKTYEAEVVKGDLIRDMALVKVKDPPPNLPSVKLAKSAPQIAEKVISLGHAGIGFLWAAKTCSIASIGERQHDTSRLAAYDCTNPDPSLSKAEAEAFKTRCDESKKQMNEALMAATQGIAIQTDCAITHGDSGGPLVNAAGELVGLNQSISVDMATASFHVHLDEIKNFLSKYPEQPIAIVPDPFCDGGSNPSLEDLDLDGAPDTLVTTGSQGFFGNYDRMSLLIDLDEDQFKKKIDNAKKEGIDAFETEIALLRIHDAAYIWYDTDNDGHFDLLLVDKDDDGKPEKAYHIDAEGHPKLDEAALPGHDLSGKLVKDPALRVRLGKIASSIGGAKYTSERTQAAASKATSLPDPILGGGTQGRVLDSDGDGKPDIAVMRGAFSRAMLIDADEDSLNKLKSGDAADDVVKSKKIDAEVSIVIQASSVWVTYDMDNDGKFDLTLMTDHNTDPTSMVATQAWHLGAGGEMTPAPDQI